MAVLLAACGPGRPAGEDPPPPAGALVTADAPAVVAVLGDGALGSPIGLALTDRALLVVEDLHHRITSFDVATTAYHVMGRHGVAAGELSSPDAVAVGPSGELFVADTGNNRIQVWDAGGRYRREFGRGHLWWGLLNPRDVVLAGTDVLVADHGRSRVRVFDVDGRFRRDISGTGTPGELSRPIGLAVSGDGELFVSDTARHHVVVFGVDGSFRRVIGAAGGGAGQFHHPHGIALGPGGLLYVADRGNDRVQVLTTDGHAVRAVGRTGAAAGELESPTDVIVAADGRIFVADYGNKRVQIWR